MRDVVTNFYCTVLQKQITAGSLLPTDRVLVVCGGELDEAVMRKVGFRDFVITGLGRDGQDAENLPFADEAFDVAIVHAGLHHCYSPHRALLEMYRVARKQVLAFEARDSFLMRTAVKLGLTLDYETDSDGVADTGIPNFIYRWTEREVIKTVASFDPLRPPSVSFFYDLRIPVQRFASSGKRGLRFVGTAIEPLSRVLAKLLPGQCNEFSFVITKGGRPHPWIRSTD